MYVHPNQGCFSLNLQSPGPFRLHETVLEQGSGGENEDTLSVDNELYIVCDGATTISGAQTDGEVSGGRQAAAITADVFSRNRGSLEAMAEQANNQIFQAMSESSAGLEEREALWSTSFAALRFKGEHIEWAQSGDCMILLIHQDGFSELLTEQTGHDIATLQRWKEIGPFENGTIHQVLSREIGEVRRGMNRDYGVLNGEQEALDFVNYGVKKVDTVTDIILFSDGLWLPSGLPEKPLDPHVMAALYARVGLNGLKKQIRCIQRKDPRCFRYPRFKMFDDVSAIALKRV